VNLQDVRKDLAELREGYKRLRTELQDHHAETAAEDRFAKQMWTFIGKAGRDIDDLVDNVNHADTSYAEVVQYYGEDEKSMSSSEFYGIFKTFVTSYTVRLSLTLRMSASHHYILDSRDAKATTELSQKRSWRWRKGDRLPRKEGLLVPRPLRTARPTRRTMPF
jgi:cytokinesis protein